MVFVELLCLETSWPKKKGHGCSFRKNVMRIIRILWIRSVKQETTTYRSTIPNFDTVDDNVKAYCGIDYNAVYKKKKDIDMESLEQYQRREFIPGRKAFWKV